METKANTFQIRPVGAVQRDDEGVIIQIDAAYRAALTGLGTFSHVIVYWWADHFDQPTYREMLVTPLPYAGDREAGVFASRAPVRPNVIMSTVCEILSVDTQNGAVHVKDIDAFAGTPVIDLKAYFPVMDRVKNARITDDLVGWPEWMPDEGIGLMEGEN